MPLARALYLSYDGMLEPLGQSQVVAYLEKLAVDHGIWLISFEKPEDRADRAAMAAMRARLAAAGIIWWPLAYHKRPSGPATLYDILIGTMLACGLVLRHRIRILHARSYVAALMALWTKRVTGAKFVFDMRGFWADERVEGGLWPEGGRLYRIAKACEARFFRRADHIVVLTRAASRWLADQGVEPPHTVIPTCADLDRFSPIDRQDGPFVLGYVGSFGTWYLMEETIAFFCAIRRLRPEARLLIVNRHEHSVLRAALDRAGVPPDCVTIAAAAHDDVPHLVRQMSAAVAFCRPSFSKLGSAPTKLGEYLGCGVPCAGNSGIGDVAELLSGGTGVVLNGFAPEDLDRAARNLIALAEDPATRQKCRDQAQALFSLAGGVAAYDRIYQDLTG